MNWLKQGFTITWADGWKVQTTEARQSLAFRSFPVFETTNKVTPHTLTQVTDCTEASGTSHNSLPCVYPPCLPVLPTSPCQEEGQLIETAIQSRFRTLKELAVGGPALWKGARANSKDTKLKSTKFTVFITYSFIAKALVNAGVLQAVKCRK